MVLKCICFWQKLVNGVKIPFKTISIAKVHFKQIHLHWDRMKSIRVYSFVQQMIRVQSSSKYDSSHSRTQFIWSIFLCVPWKIRTFCVGIRHLLFVLPADGIYHSVPFHSVNCNVCSDQFCLFKLVVPCSYNRRQTSKTYMHWVELCEA